MLVSCQALAHKHVGSSCYKVKSIRVRKREREERQTKHSRKKRGRGGEEEGRGKGEGVRMLGLGPLFFAATLNWLYIPSDVTLLPSRRCYCHIKRVLDDNIVKP